MTDAEFEQLVADGIDALPDVVRKRMRNVAIVIADAPSVEQLQDGLSDGEALFGLYEGVPLTERNIDDMFLPDKITIFKLPILATYDDPADIVSCVHNTVWHEVAHHFGMDEERVAFEEERRGKML